MHKSQLLIRLVQRNLYDPAPVGEWKTVLDWQVAGLQRSVCMIKINGRCQRILAGLGECWFIKVLD